MISAQLSIETGSRLHFGLLSWGANFARQFGGFGLMVEAPGLRLHVEPGEGRVQGPLAERVRAVVAELQAAGLELPPFNLTVEAAPPEHLGLGTGTQLSLSVARLLMQYAGLEVLGAAKLAQLTRRGLRSGVGLHGFDHGGLIVDGGRKGAEGMPPLLSRLSFPEEWSILIVIPDGPAGLHGLDERSAFRTLPPFDPAMSDRLCRLLLLELLPAVQERNLTDFGHALETIQAHVGEAFAPAQGGAFGPPQFESIARNLHEHGVVGVGQSSWGPAIYGFALDPRSDVLERLSSALQLDPGRAFWTRARNQGALLSGGSTPASG